MKAYERLLKYVTFRTPSDENSENTPSSACQFELARFLKNEMEGLNLSDIVLDDMCYLYGKLPATKGYENVPAIGFIAHMDTVSDYCNHDITPVITENFNGVSLKLPAGITLSVHEFPHLGTLKERTLITSDGSPILGADDKAGIAEILTMIEHLQKGNIPHGTICIAFTPDEEIGMGAEHFNIEQFGAMINASLVAMEINNALPAMETPRSTEDYEGFYHLVSMSGDVSEASLNYIVRDHDKNLFEAKKNTLRLIEKNMNEKWGKGTVTLTIKDQYKNMSEIIAGCMNLIDNAKKACELADITPLILPIRGGTDGCQLSFKGLPCPNLGTGGHAYHGEYEHITVEGMDMTVAMLVKLVGTFIE